MTEFTGEDEFRKKLVELGFRIYKNNFQSDVNLCNWYGCRRTRLEAIHCECNEIEPQLVVNPYTFYNHDSLSRQVDVNVTGELNNGIWYKLMVYSMNPEYFLENIDKIEKSLISAWNALYVNESN